MIRVYFYKNFYKFNFIAINASIYLIISAVDAEIKNKLLNTREIKKKRMDKRRFIRMFRDMFEGSRIVEIA